MIDNNILVTSFAVEMKIENQIQINLCDKTAIKVTNPITGLQKNILNCIFLIKLLIKFYK